MASRRVISSALAARFPNVIEELRKAFPGWALSMIVTVATTLTLFYGNFTRLESRVDQNTETLKTFVSRDEYIQSREAQSRMTARMLDRLEKVDDKINQIHVILIEKAR